MATAVISRNIWVEINLNTPSAKIELSMEARDEAEWFSKNNQDFTVSFTESPFADKVFHVPNGGSVCSGPPTKTGKYTYTVKDSQGKVVVKPSEIVIKP